MKKNPPILLPFVVSVRFAEREFRQIVAKSQAGRHTLSQAVRILIETALRESKAT
jgi:hypothetical protein